MDWTDLPLARATVDRAAERRAEPGLLATLRADASTGVLLVHAGLVATVRGGDGTDLELLSPDALAEAAPSDDGWLFLGADDDRSYLAYVVPDADVDIDAEADDPPALVAEEADVEGTPMNHAAGEDAAGPAAADWAAADREADRATERAFDEEADQAAVDAAAAHVAADHLAAVRAALVSGHEWSHLRHVGSTMAARDAGLGVTAVALAAWHRSHRCCPRCGAPTVVGYAGWVRHCPVDGRDQYPRTDPAVIMAVVDGDDRLLLGHAAHWPERRFSTLAGYVEPGEGLEQAVRREVDEEVGVTVGAVEYRGSQPWPFPASLMLAFRAVATTTDLTPDGVEVTDARWFTRAELAGAVAAGEVLLPMRASIARALIEEWAGSPLPGD